MCLIHSETYFIIYCFIVCVHMLPPESAPGILGKTVVAAAKGLCHKVGWTMCMSSHFGEAGVSAIRLAGSRRGHYSRVPFSILLVC